MPYVDVGKENSGAISLYYEDHGSGGKARHHASTVASERGIVVGGSPRCAGGGGVSASSPPTAGDSGNSSKPLFGLQLRHAERRSARVIAKLIEVLEVAAIRIGRFVDGRRRSGAIYRQATGPRSG